MYKNNFCSTSNQILKWKMKLEHCSYSPISWSQLEVGWRWTFHWLTIIFLKVIQRPHTHSKLSLVSFSVAMPTLFNDRYILGTAVFRAFLKFCLLKLAKMIWAMFCELFYLVTLTVMVSETSAMSSTAILAGERSSLVQTHKWISKN